MKQKRKRKGIFFSIDGIIAFSIMFVGLMLISSRFISERPVGGQIHVSQDVAAVLGELRVSEVNNPYLNGLIGNGTIQGAALNNSILEQTAQFWAENQSSLATALLTNITYQLFPDLSDFQFKIADDAVYNVTTTTPTIVIPMKRIVTGIAKDRVTRGIIARAYLTSVSGKATSRYLYYGGFVGQGNSTKFLDNIPSDANITEIYLEVDSGKNFTVFINDIQCGGEFISLENNLTADSYDLSPCNTSIILEQNVKNNFTVKFPRNGTDNHSFIGGGFLRISYLTGELLDLVEGNSTTHWFPGIDGIVNYYSAVAAPGTIIGMDAYLHYNASNKTSHFLIGSSEVHASSSDPLEEHHHYLNDTYLQSMLDYNTLSNGTVPLRMYFFNLTPVWIYVGGKADVIIITDLSGSMKRPTDSWGNAGIDAGGLGNYLQDCRDKVYVDPRIRRTEGARCMGMEVVDILMNYSSNRVYPVQYFEPEAVNYTSTTKADLMDFYISQDPDEFPVQGKGDTCMGCGLNKAYDLLGDVGNESRDTFIILMTDGIPTHCPDDGCEAGNSTSYDKNTDKQCDGIGDNPGFCGDACVTNGCNDCIANPGATEHALYAAQRLVDDFNTTIFTIGFGPLENCSMALEVLENISMIGKNGSFNHSGDIGELRDIYEEIAFDILEKANLSSQAVVLENGTDQNPESELFADSYLRINYTPAVTANTHGVISLTMEISNATNCTTTAFIENEFRVLRAGLTSYSSEHWTDGLWVNGQEVYNLSIHSLEYYELGDPYYVHIPANLIVPGTNTFRLRTGDNPVNETGCSPNTTFIFTAEINLSVPYSGVSEKADGCVWDIEYEGDVMDSITIPLEPLPTESCTYNSTFTDYNDLDAYQSAAYSLFSQLDFDDDGKINIRFDELDLTIDSVTVEEVPSLWGPTIAEVKTWQ